MADVIDFVRRKKFLLEKREAEAETSPEIDKSKDDDKVVTLEERRQKSQEARRKIHNMRVTRLQKLRKEQE